MLYLRSLGDSWRLKNASGCQASPTHCSYTAPTAKSDASVVRAVGAEGEGWANMAAGARAALVSWKALTRSAVQSLQSLALLGLVQRLQDVSYVLEEAIVKGHHPDEPLELADCAGRRKAATASTFEGRGVTPSAETWCPRKSRVSRPNSHFAGLTISPCWLSRVKRGPEVGQVLFLRGARDEDVIQVDEEEGQVLEHRVH